MFDREWSIANVGTGATVVLVDPLSIPDSAKSLELAAWQASNGNLPAIIFRDNVSLSEAQNRVASDGIFDALMVVPPGGVGRVRLDPDVRVLTIFFPLGNAAGQAQFVTVRICGE